MNSMYQPQQTLDRFFLASEKCTGENYIERKQKQKQNKTKTNQPTNPLLEEVLETT